MTDRELLELAAKAAGISFFVDSRGRGMQMHGGLMPAPWNPLTDDGDALRLAVKLEMQLRLRHSDNVVIVYGSPDGRVDEGVCGDPLVATRRAIVRAAAEIGRAMQ